VKPPLQSQTIHVILELKKRLRTQLDDTTLAAGVAATDPDVTDDTRLLGAIRPHTERCANLRFVDGWLDEILHEGAIGPG